MKKIVPILALLLVAACGGNAATQPPAPQTTSAQPTPPGQGGGPIDAATIQAAVAALKAHQSWQFGLTTYQSGTPNFSTQADGTQRSMPQPALMITITQAGKADKRYTQVGVEVWYDTGTGTYTTTKTSDNYVSSSFSPYYLDGLVQSAETNGYEFLPLGPDDVNGVAATHYRLAEETVQAIVQTMKGMPTADWAADVWLTSADGSLLRLAWGPKSADKAGLTTGVDYAVTSLDCTCPVGPPA